MKTILTLLFVLCSILSFSQKNLEIERIKKIINDAVDSAKMDTVDIKCKAHCCDDFCFKITFHRGNIKIISTKKSSFFAEELERRFKNYFLRDESKKELQKIKKTYVIIQTISYQNLLNSCDTYKLDSLSKANSCFSDVKNKQKIILDGILFTIGWEE